MAELNLKQISDKLNSEFESDARRLVFWYDSNAEFESDVDTLDLVNAKVLRLYKDNQFSVKNFIERKDIETNYLIYAPFAKPSLRDNHLADTLRYSKEFFADRASLLAIDLGIGERHKQHLEKYIKFFAAKDRTQKFYDLEIEVYNKQVIETGIMGVLCKTKVVSFEEIARTLIIEEDLENNKYLSEFEKYGLIEAFWSMCESTFGYTDVEPNLEKLILTMFATYTSKVISRELPQSWKNFASFKSGNIIAFLDGLMNSLVYFEDYNRLSDLVYLKLNAEESLANIAAEELVECELYKNIDRTILRWLIERLETEDLSAKLSGHSIPEICEIRRKMHFGNDYSIHYSLLENAYHIIKIVNFEPQKTVEGIVSSYVDNDYMTDQRYRYFYYYFDQLLSNEAFEDLRDLVENIYTNRYLDKLALAWSDSLSSSKMELGITKQRRFYNKFIRGAKERIVVIISDAFRYEVGISLIERLESDEKSTSTIESMQSVIPSYTRFGMSALLPHRELVMNDAYKVLVDGKVCDDLKSREQVLQTYEKNSRAIQFDDIKSMKIAELKEVFAGQQVVYIYHNQIDARGDKLNTENEVFTACEEAIDEVSSMIKRLTSANNTHFIVTADHGFIYKRDKIVESDKISGFDKKNSLAGRRYIVDETGVNSDGVTKLSLGDVLGNNDARTISVPSASDVFKVSGGGQNFVHGGASIQEMIIPVIDIRTTKKYTETKAVGIGLVSLVNKITNLTTNLDFIQSDPISEIFKETTYKLFFISDDNEKISNENKYVADKRDNNASKRIFRLKFTFKNKKYDRNRKYYLVAYDEKNSIEVIRHEIKMDLAFVDDFGF